MNPMLIIIMFILSIILIYICSRGFVSEAIEDKAKKQELEELYNRNKENYEKWKQSYLMFYNEVNKYYTKDVEKVIYDGGTTIENKKISISEKLCITPTNNEIIIYNNWDLLNENEEIRNNIQKKIISHYLYDENGNLKYYKPPRYKMEYVKYFKKNGNVETLTNISGGGRPSISGAIVGGLIAGDVGAIIGSRAGTKEITTTYETKDTRTTTISFNNITFECNGWELYDRLMEIIPNKEYNCYISKKREEFENDEKTNK